jgi:hypothetical protein
MHPKFEDQSLSKSHPEDNEAINSGNFKPYDGLPTYFELACFAMKHKDCKSGPQSEIDEVMERYR